MDIYSKRDLLFRELARLRDEIARVETEALELETLIKLGEKHNALRDPRPRAAAEIVQTVVNRLGGPGQKTLREQIVWAATEVLKDGRRRVARELLPEMAALGVTLGGKNPPSNLSTYLSREKDIFVCDVKAGGWTLCQFQKKARPEDVAASQASLLTAH